MTFWRYKKFAITQPSHYIHQNLVQMQWPAQIISFATHPYHSTWYHLTFTTSQASELPTCLLEGRAGTAWKASQPLNHLFSFNNCSLWISHSLNFFLIKFLIFFSSLLCCFRGISKLPFGQKRPKLVLDLRLSSTICCKECITMSTTRFYNLLFCTEATLLTPAKEWSFPLNTVGTCKDIFSLWDVTFIYSLGCTQEVCWKWAGTVYSNLCLRYRSTRSSQHNLQRWSPEQRSCERRTCAAGWISNGWPDQTNFLMSVIQPLLKFGR